MIDYTDAEGIMGVITHKSRVYNVPYKQYNYALAFYSRDDKSINPKLILRFDCHKINDLQCVKLYERDPQVNSLEAE